MNSFTGIELPEVLTDDEIKELFKQYKNGDKSAEEKLVLHNIRLVLKLAKSYSTKYNVDMEDLVSEGLLRLTYAVRYFNPSLNYKFSTYSGSLIARAMVEYIKKSSESIIKVSINDKLTDDLTIEDTIRSNENIEKNYICNETVREILSMLTPEEQALYKLRFIDELNFKSIGQILNMTPTLVSAKLDRLTIRLKIVYKEYYSSRNEIILNRFNELNENIKDYFILSFSNVTNQTACEKYNLTIGAISAAKKRALKKLGCTKEELYSILVDAKIIDGGIKYGKRQGNGIQC